MGCVTWRNVDEGGEDERVRIRTATPNLSASVYTLACFSSCAPSSSIAGVEGSAVRLPLGSLAGKYSPV